MRPHLFIIIFYAIALYVISPPSFSAYTTMTIEGVKQANGVWTAAGVMDTSGFVRTTGAVSVMGTTRNLPVAFKAKPIPASAMLKSTARLMGPIALAAAAYDVYEWVTSNGISEDNGQWVLISEDSQDPYYDMGSEWRLGSYYSSPSSACRAWHATQKNLWQWSEKWDVYDTKIPGVLSCRIFYQSQPSVVLVTADVVKVNCRSGSDNQSCVPYPVAGPSNFDNLPMPSNTVLANGFNNIPSLISGGAPFFEDSMSFTPYPQWIGDPYFKDGNWYRDRMDVSPAPTKSQPTRVKADIGPVKIDGATDPNTVPDTNTGGGSAQPKEKPSFCEANPGSIACQEMGSLEQEPFNPVEKPFNITPQNPWGSGDAQCPAPKVMHLTTGSTVTLSYQPACDFFRGVRPAVLALALLAALYIALGIPVGKGD